MLQRDGLGVTSHPSWAYRMHKGSCCKAADVNSSAAGTAAASAGTACPVQGAPQQTAEDLEG